MVRRRSIANIEARMTTNASGVVRGVKQASDSMRGFSRNMNQQSRVIDGISNRMVGSIAAIGAAIVAAFAVNRITNFIESVSNAAIELDRNARALGTTVANTQAISRVLRDLGEDNPTGFISRIAEFARDAVENFSSLSSLEIPGLDKFLAQLANLRDPIEQLIELDRFLKSIDSQRARALIFAIFGSEDATRAIPIFLSESIAKQLELAKAIGVATDAQNRQAAEVGRSLNRIREAFSNIGIQLLAELDLKPLLDEIARIPNEAAKAVRGEDNELEQVFAEIGEDAARSFGRVFGATLGPLLRGITIGVARAAFDDFFRGVDRQLRQIEDAIVGAFGGDVEAKRLADIKRVREALQEMGFTEKEITAEQDKQAGLRKQERAAIEEQAKRDNNRIRAIREEVQLRRNAARERAESFAKEEINARRLADAFRNAGEEIRNSIQEPAGASSQKSIIEGEIEKARDRISRLKQVLRDPELVDALRLQLGGTMPSTGQFGMMSREGAEALIRNRIKGEQRVIQEGNKRLAQIRETTTEENKAAVAANNRLLFQARAADRLAERYDKIGDAARRGFAEADKEVGRVNKALEQSGRPIGGPSASGFGDELEQRGKALEGSLKEQEASKKRLVDLDQEQLGIARHLEQVRKRLLTAERKIAQHRREFDDASILEKILRLNPLSSGIMTADAIAAKALRDEVKTREENLKVSRQQSIQEDRKLTAITEQVGARREAYAQLLRERAAARPSPDSDIFSDSFINRTEQATQAAVKFREETNRVAYRIRLLNGDVINLFEFEPADPGGGPWGLRGAERTVETIGDGVKRTGEEIEKSVSISATGTERLLELMNERAANIIDIERVRRVTAEMERQYEESLRRIQATYDQVAFSIQGSFSDAFVDIVNGVKSVGDAFEDLGKRITTTFLRVAADNLANQLFFSIFGGGPQSSGGGFLSGILRSLGINFFASGGRANPGLAVVGERGPELVYFNRPADVVPNSALGGVNIVNNFSVAPGVSRAEMRAAAIEAYAVALRDAARAAPSAVMGSPRFEHNFG